MDVEQRLRDIEEKEGVRILFACESGSRAWGFSSKDSDWDVRFIYAPPLAWYLTVEPSRDVIEVVDGMGCDAAGWEIRKALHHFRRSNPSLLEWLTSPIIYRDEASLRQRLLALLPDYYDSTHAVYHYFHIATHHQTHYLEHRGVELKRFCYYLRALLACQWILREGTPPPVPFATLVAAEVDDDTLRREIESIVAIKSASREHDKDNVPPRLQEYGAAQEEQIRRYLADYRPSRHPHPEKDNTLDALLLDIVNGKK